MYFEFDQPGEIGGDNDVYDDDDDVYDDDDVDDDADFNDDNDDYDVFSSSQTTSNTIGTRKGPINYDDDYDSDNYPLE